MILSFANKGTQKIWEGVAVKALPIELQEIARRKLRMLNSSENLNGLTIPPSNRLETLRGRLREYYSIRINEQWRIIFKWENGNAKQVQIIDYH